MDAGSRIQFGYFIGVTYLRRNGISGMQHGTVATWIYICCLMNREVFGFVEVGTEHEKEGSIGAAKQYENIKNKINGKCRINKYRPLGQ